MLNLFGKNANTLPAGRIEQNGQSADADPGLVALALRGWTLKRQIEDWQKELKAINDHLENSLGAGASVEVAGVCRATVAARQTFKLTDVDTCQSLLGGRFTDLVETSVEFTLSEKLKAIVLDPDHPLSAGLRGCVQIKDGVSVSYKPIRPE